MQSKAESLHEWVGLMRTKFDLPEEEVEEPNPRARPAWGDFWRGYNACLGDVGRLADHWAAAGGEGTVGDACIILAEGD